MLPINSSDYFNQETLYEGKLSFVFRSIHKNSNQKIIIKLLKQEYPSPEQLARFRREFEVTQKLYQNIKNFIIKPFELVKYQNTLLMILEDFGATSLDRILHSSPFNLEEFLEIAIQITEALGKIHEQNILHKDINPSNILYNSQKKIIKIIDFGIASNLDFENFELENLHSIEGTFSYISPEQTGRINRNLDYRSDYYSLGITLYELLTGQLPFLTKNPMELVYAHIAKIPIPPHVVHPEISLGLSSIIMKLIEKSPENRYQSTFGIIEDLKICLKQLKIGQPIANFPLATKDRPSYFKISGKLYGREIEKQELLQSFLNIVQGKAHLSLISGYPGIGKSSLIYELIPSLANHHGFYALGKCDPYKRNIPYDSLLQALEKIIQQILNLEPNEISYWKSILQNSLGSYGKLITNVLPQLTLIVDIQKDLEELSPNLASRQFKTVFHNFIQALANEKHPLTIFLDDLQWADLYTIELMTHLLSDPDTHHLLLIGTYRHNEVDQNHALFLMLEDLKKKQIPFQEFKLSPLSLENIFHLLSDSLHSSLEDVKPLGEVCFIKTQGNPFFINRLLISLYKNKSISFNYQKGIWQWDLTKIKKQEITDNVIEFMSAKIAELPKKTQEILWIASCIGNRFDLKTLAHASHQSLEKTANDLWPSLKEGLIIPINDNYKFIDNAMNTEVLYHFLHDRVQQAVYAFIPLNSREEIHYLIGKIFITQNDSTHPEQLFNIVNQMNLGSRLISDKKEKIHVAELNYQAGIKAKESSSFTSAVNYFQKGINLLPENHWEESYLLSYKLYLQFAESLHIIGDHRYAENIAKTALEKAHTPMEKASIITILEDTYSSLGDFEQAIDIGLYGLKILGIKLSKNPSKLSLIKEFFLSKIYLGQRPVADLINLPELTDPKLKMIIKITQTFDTPAYYCGYTNLTGMLTLKQINILLKNGNTVRSSQVFLAYAVMLTVIGDLKQGYAFSQLALNLLEKYPDKSFKSRIIAVYAQMIHIWHFHFKTLKPYFQEAAQIGLESGDNTTALIGITYLLLLDPELPLEEVVKKSKPYLKLIKQSGNPNAWDTGQIQFQFRANLSGTSTGDLFSLSSPEFHEKEGLERMKTSQFKTGVALYYIYKATLHYTYEDYNKALEYITLVDPYRETIAGGIFFMEYIFYSFYIRAANYFSLSGWKKFQTWRVLQKNAKIVKEWAEQTPINFLHHQLLMEAELYRLSNQPHQAIKSYNQAILAAKKNEYIRFEALANELCAKFYLNLQINPIAKLYFQDARYCYQKWGAFAKIKHLENTYSTLLTPLQQDFFINQDTSITTTGKTSTEVLDFISVMKASQTITREIQLNNLLTKMMAIVIENAGAEKGFLILNNQGHFEIEAYADSQKVQLMASQPLKDLPLSIINTVIRTKEPLVISNASKEETLLKDPYFKKQPIKSILCVPLVNLGEIKGMLYLENNFSEGVFTQQRLDVINMLSAQMAISINNALFYSQLEEKVELRTRELKETQNQLIQKEKMAFLGLLTTGLGHEMKNPLNFIINFSEFSKDLLEELKQILKEKPTRALQDLPELNDTVQQLIDTVESTYQQGKKADTIVNRMIEHSAITGQQFVLSDLNQIVDQSISIAKHKLQERYPNFKVTLIKDFDKSLPEFKVADIDLQCVIMNLIDNAYYTLFQKLQKKDASFNPVLTIKTSKLAGYAIIKVKDNGEGIAQNSIDKIFTPFFTTRPTGEGVGLGLSLCHNIIVKEHEGALTFSTVQGEYTEFVIQLPFKV